MSSSRRALERLPWESGSRLKSVFSAKMECRSANLGSALALQVLCKHDSTERCALAELASPSKVPGGPKGNSGSAAQHGWVIAIPDTQIWGLMYLVSCTPYPKVKSPRAALNLIRKHMSTSARTARLS